MSDTGTPSSSSSSSSSISTATGPVLSRRLQQKIRAEARASATLDPNLHLHILYRDADICVTHKPSGILCVPGPRRNPSLANLMYDHVQPEGLDIDQTVVHRLDMDTSGIVVFALTARALRKLHHDFRGDTEKKQTRHKKNKNNKKTNDDDDDDVTDKDDASHKDRSGVSKVYQALVCGHVLPDEGEWDVPLERDPHRPPFMRVHIPRADSSDTAASALMGNDSSRNDGATSIPVYNSTMRVAHKAFRQKLVRQAPKPSFTSFRVLSREYKQSTTGDGQMLPVTRLRLIPKTGRTHQLRVHCAAAGHPIVGDVVYGIHGEGSPDGGLSISPNASGLPTQRASKEVQEGLYRLDLSLCLHAERLCIRHPCTGANMVFSAERTF